MHTRNGIISHLEKPTEKIKQIFELTALELGRLCGSVS